MDPSVLDPGGMLARCDARRDELPAAPVDASPDVAEVRFRFPTPAPVVSQNAVESWHWSDRAAHRSAWRQAACAAADGAAAALAPLRGHRVEVTVALPVADKRRRDPSNWMATCVKPILDGITDAAALWPDDNATWVTVREPVLWTGPDVVVPVTEAPPAWDPSVDDVSATV